MKVARYSLKLWIPDLGATTTGVVSRTIGVGPVPGQVVIAPDGSYTYEADMDGVSVTKTRRAWCRRPSRPAGLTSATFRPEWRSPRRQAHEGHQ